MMPAPLRIVAVATTGTRRGTLLRAHMGTTSAAFTGIFSDARQ